jgi:hypothetical protein
MTEVSDITVRLDDRARLLSAVLAVTDFPEQAQRLKPHGTHAHARATRKHLQAHSEHLAVQATQHMLDQNIPLEAIYVLVLLMDWPDLSLTALPGWATPDYNILLRDFYEQAQLGDWWQREGPLWDKAIVEATNALQDLRFKPFLKPFLGDIDQHLVFMPNISYPTDGDTGFQIGDELVCIAPPPLAWGDSPPWPYDEPTMIAHSYRTAMTVFGGMLLANYLRAYPEQVAEIARTELPLSEQFKLRHPTWEDQFSTLFLSAVVAMYLEDYVDEKEYRAYVLMEKKARGLTNLPGTVNVLRRYLQEVGNDRYSNLIEFLPYFPRQLRVAQRMVSI